MDNNNELVLKVGTKIDLSLPGEIFVTTYRVIEVEENYRGRVQVTAVNEEFESYLTIEEVV